MRNICILLFIALTFTGCAAVKQAVQDKKLSDATPVAFGEVSPDAQAKALADKIAPALASAPYGSGVLLVPIAGLLIAKIGAWFFGWRRGRKLRLLNTQITSENPVTGSAGQAIGLESIIQHVADVRAGLLEVGKPGGALHTGWKLTALASLGAFLYPHIEPLINYLHTNPPAWASPIVLGAIVGGLGILEKQLAKVLPVAPSA